MQAANANADLMTAADLVAVADLTAAANLTAAAESIAPESYTLLTAESIS